MAAAIIMSLDDNPIDSAERAVTANDLAVLKESVGIANAQYRLSDKSMTKDEYIYDYLNRNGIAYTGYHIENGKLVEGEEVVASKWTSSNDITTQWYYNDPSSTEFTINSASDLAGLAEIVNKKIDDFSGKIVYLNVDINLNDNSWIPIGNDYNFPFKGVFDGDSHIIYRLNISGTYVGLFGHIINGSLLNLTIRDSNLNLESGCGVFVGFLYDSTLSNCHSLNNEIKSKNDSGGIVLEAAGSVIEDCSNTSNVVSTQDKSGPLSSSAGIIGADGGNCTISNCYNLGNITTSGTDAGGIVGQSFPTSQIIGCYNMGTITSNLYTAGGIVASQGEGNIQDCYNIGKVSGKIYGEIAGEAGTTILNSYYLSGRKPTGSGSGDHELYAKSDSDFKASNFVSSNNLSTHFKVDSNNKNKGYPILYWQ